MGVKGPGDRSRRVMPDATQVLHGCRQLVSLDVGLSPATSATLIFSCQRVKLGTLEKLPVTSRRKGDDVKSSWPLRAGLHTCYNGGDRGLAMERSGANPEKPSQFGLHSATRVHEVGIASNRGTACRGEYVPGPCTHRPSRHGSWLYPKAVLLTRKGGSRPR